MTVNRPLLGLIAVLALAVGGYLAYDLVLRGDVVAPLTLPSASPAAPSPSDPGAGTDGEIAGTWAVAADSVAGYRVREQLASLPAESDAVGRTPDVTGSITLVTSGDGTRLTEGSLSVDTTTIASDEDRRDDRMRSEGLATDQFPTATFTLTAPVDVPAAGLAGTPTDVVLVGDLTLHGVTKPVEIPARAQLADGVISVAGSLSFALADFAIEAPNVGGFIVSIADEGTLEFLVNFTRS